MKKENKVKIFEVKSKRKVIQVPVPKTILDAHMSIFNYRDIFGAWAQSIIDVVKQINEENETNN